MKTLNIMKNIGKGYLYLVGFFVVLMAMDCFGSLGCPSCDSVWDQLLCFGMSIIPGLIIIAVVYFLRNREKVLGVALIVLAIVAFFFFKFYREFSEKIPIFLIISLVPLLIGILFVFASGSNKEEQE